MASLSAQPPYRTLPRLALRRLAGRLGALCAAPGVVDLDATSCEELEAACAGWEVRYLALGPGRCCCRHVLVHTPRLQLCYEEWSLGLLKVGRAPRGWTGVVVPVGRQGCARVEGRPSQPGEAVALFDGEEFDYRSWEPTQLVSVSMERTALEGHVRALFGRYLGELRLQGRLNGLRTDAALLRGLCLDLAARTAVQPGLLRDPALAQGLETTLVKALFQGLEGPGERTAPSHGLSLALKAEAWLRHNLAEPPSIADLCAALGANERTLHQAFRAHLRTTPKAYLKTLRLNAARQDLLDGAARKRVTDVALDWGFLHFGWFSQDYRRLFGETPSQTLQRGRGEPAARLPSAGPTSSSRRAGVERPPPKPAALLALEA